MNIKARQIFWFWVSFPTNSTAINARKQYAGKKIWKRQRGKRLRQNKIAYCHLYHCVAAAAIKLTRCHHAAHESITVRCIAWADWPVAYCRRSHNRLNDATASRATQVVHNVSRASEPIRQFLRDSVGVICLTSSSLSSPQWHVSVCAVIQGPHARPVFTGRACAVDFRQAASHRRCVRSSESVLSPVM